MSRVTPAPTAGESTAAAGPAGTSGSLPGIAARPAIDPEVLAVLAAAVDQAWPRRRIVVLPEPHRPPAWRFSGRWWSRPATTRRDRPWAGG